ncbi:hypothetical protein SLE2022_207670 [Rubroshorea leprosula]
MALLHLQASVPITAVSTRPVALSLRSRRNVPARMTLHKSPNQPRIRRPADYQPTIWSFEHIQSRRRAMQRLISLLYSVIFSYNMKPILLDLAKLDFNLVQATYQEDLKRASM